MLLVLELKLVVEYVLFSIRPSVDNDSSVTNDSCEELKSVVSDVCEENDELSWLESVDIGNNTVDVGEGSSLDIFVDDSKSELDISDDLFSSSEVIEDNSYSVDDREDISVDTSVEADDASENSTVVCTTASVETLES